MRARQAALEQSKTRNCTLPGNNEPADARPVRRRTSLRILVPALWGLAALTACSSGGGGGGGGGSGSAPGVPGASGTPGPANAPTPGMQPGATTNRAPSISGAPVEAVRIGDKFAFRPTAVDADGDPLTFGVFNSPLWMTFDPATGTLEGKPTAADVGFYRNIEISVSDGRQRAVLVFELEVVVLGTGSITLSWVPATQRVDGSRLDKVRGHKIYWGRTPGDYPNVFVLNNPGITRYVITGLVRGTYYVAMSTVDGDGIESELTASVEIRVTS
jgi:hypothetical protein